MNKRLIYLFILLIILKVIFSTFITFPLGFSDSLTYQESAKTFFDTLSILQMSETKYPLLYSILISPAFFFEDMNTVLFIIKIINSILSSLIIFPVYLLSKEFFNKNKSFLIAAISAFIPPFFIFTFTSMSENLFYPLFLFAVYSIYKAFKENTLKWNIFSGILIGLCFLTKILGVILIPIIIILISLNIKQLKQKIYLLITSFVIYLIWIIPRLINSGFNFIQATGYQPSLEKATSALYLSTKFIWFFLYLDYLILACGIIFFFLAIFLIYKYKSLKDNEKLLIQITLLSTFFLLILCANHSGGFNHYNDYKTIGRYIECLIPLFLILSFIQLEKKETIPKILLFIFSIFTIISSYFIIFDKFYPLNNSALIHIGILKYIIEYLEYNSQIILTIIIGLFILTIFLINKLKIINIYKILFIFFIILSLLNTAVIYYNTEKDWMQTESVELGLWINENLRNSSFLFDIDEQKEERPSFIAGYWIRNKWKIEQINDNYDYIITKKELDKEVIYTGKDGTKIHKA